MQLAPRNVLYKAHCVSVHKFRGDRPLSSARLGFLMPFNASINPCLRPKYRSASDRFSTRLHRPPPALVSVTE